MLIELYQQATIAIHRNGWFETSNIYHQIELSLSSSLFEQKIQILNLDRQKIKLT